MTGQTGMTVTPARRTEWDVVVVGAGVAGLNCARQLTGSGFSVLVLEATSRIGGRVRTHHDADGRPWELGAQVVHGEHNALWDELGVGSVGDSFRDTVFRCVLGGRQRDIGVLAQVGGAPWSTNAAVAALPQDVLPQSMSDWLGARALPGLATRVVGWWMAQEWAAEPGELDCAELAGTVRSRQPVTSEAVVAGGFATLPALLAQGLHIELDSPVRQIDTFGDDPSGGSGNGVLVRTDAGVVTAGAVVVTVPPWTIGADGLRIPEMPEAKRSAVGALHGGDAVVAVIDVDAVCGQSATVFDADTGIGFVRSVCAGSSVQVVTKGHAAERLRTLLGDREALRTWLTTSAPWTSGAKITAVHTADWGRDRYVRGAFTVPSRDSGAATAVHAAPIGRRIFFAGESTCAATGIARVHGAFDSGRRAALEVATAV